MAAPPLPTPRALVTALLDTLALVPGEREEEEATTMTTTTPQRLPSAARPLLTTLHTLYPRLLLPALDLLDRRLVLRVIVGSDTTTTTTRSGDDDDNDGISSYYRVRSAQTPTRSRGGAASAAAVAAADPTVYVVRTGAWSCSCAPFALSAFPAQTTAALCAYVIRAADLPPQRQDDDVVGVDDDPEGATAAAAAKADREFGGRSRDGRPSSPGRVGPGGDDVPCCKHLLACVLAERWGVLTPYVEERRVGPEEAVGLMTGS